MIVPLLVVGLLTACGGLPATHSGPGPRKKTKASATAVKLTPVSFETSFVPSTSQLPIYLALARGYYKARGLKVTVTSGRGSVLTVQQVAAGQYDLGLADLTAMAQLRSKGVAVRAFMAETDRTTFGVTGAKASGIKTWKDLYGKEVLVAPGNASVFLLPATFAKLGLDFRRVRVVDVPPANLGPDYEGGKGDAASGDTAGAFLRANAKRPSDPLWFGDVLDVVGYGLFGRSDYLSAHPSVVRAFAAATAEALHALASSPAVAREAARDMIAHDPAAHWTVKDFAPAWPLYQRAIHAVPGHPLGWQAPVAWTTTLHVLRRYAGLKGDLPPSAYFTNKYLTASDT